MRNSFEDVDNVRWTDESVVLAGTVEEDKNLVEHGFEYVTDVDGMKLFRIRK